MTEDLAPWCVGILGTNGGSILPFNLLLMSEEVHILYYFCMYNGCKNVIWFGLRTFWCEAGYIQGFELVEIESLPFL